MLPPYHTGFTGHHELLRLEPPGQGTKARREFEEEAEVCCL